MIRLDFNPFSPFGENSPPYPNFSKLSARAERMEWWKGWLQESGAFPLRKAWKIRVGNSYSGIIKSFHQLLHAKMIR